jgi:hypothetical protein
MCLTAHGEVSTRVYLRDSNELLIPVDANETLQYVDYGQIMVGTELTIIVDSNAAESWIGKLLIADDDMNNATLFARGPYNEYFGGYAESILPAAGSPYFAGVYITDPYWPEEGKHVQGFEFYTDYPPGVNSGDWFIIDYNSLQIGDCNVAFYWCDPPSTPDYGLIHELWFSHVPTRDFNVDGQVDFEDFSILASYWFDSNCTEPNSCQGANLDNYGLVDINDLALFADYWLEKTK